MLCVRRITHDRTAIQGLPSRSREMDRHQIPLIIVTGNKVRMRHRCGGGVNWTGLPLNAYAVCLQEQDISRRYGQNVGDRLAFRKRLTGILTYSFDQVRFLLGGSTYLEGCTSSGDSKCNRTGGGLNESSARYIHFVLIGNCNIGSGSGKFACNRCANSPAPAGY
jgi:hypothetical protein